MQLVDNALAKAAEEGREIRVGLIGAGHFGRAVALQLLTVNPVIRLVCIANRNIEAAARAYEVAGVIETRSVESDSDLERCITQGIASITDDGMLLASSDLIDVIVDVTGSIEYSAHIVTRAIEHGKHVVLGNAELDGTRHIDNDID